MFLFFVSKVWHSVGYLVDVYQLDKANYRDIKESSFVVNLRVRA